MSTGASTGTMTQQQPQPNGLPQTNGTGPLGKKGPSGGSSGGPTPSSTPVQNGTGGGQQGLSPPPLTSNAPKYGTLIPNRIFVGGISANTTENDLMQLFSTYGTVKAAKIIQDRAGVSRGYGFITFENEDDARRPLHDPDNIILRERRLNIAPAIKKQTFGRPPAAPPYDGQMSNDGRSPAPASHPSALQHPMPPFYFGGAPPFYPGATAYYAAPPVPTAMVNSAQAQVSQAGQEQAAAAAAAAAQQAIYQSAPVFPNQTGPHQGGHYTSMMFSPMYMHQQYPLMPYEYPIYGAGAGGTTSNGGLPSPFATAGPSNNGGNSPPRGPCYAPAPGPPEAAILYTGPPPHHLFHPASIDPTTGAPAPIYTDGSFDPMTAHAHLGTFNPLAGPYGITEQEGIYIEHPDSSTTPRSFATATPPSGSTDQRSTTTPVVSLLSLVFQEEKDHAAMQGGRRPHSQPNNTNMHHPHLQSTPPNQLSMGRKGQHHAMNGGQRRPPFNHRTYNTYSYQHHPMQHDREFYPMNPASFGPPARRPRKPPPPRRTSSSTTTTNEIGAGDAPLPNTDEVLSSQIEALKV